MRNATTGPTRCHERRSELPPAGLDRPSPIGQIRSPKGVKAMKAFLILLIAVPVLYGASVYVASEYGGEVVTLSTADNIGRLVETNLWVVDFDGRPYVRAGSKNSGWIERIEATGDVELVRNGRTTEHFAEIVPDRTASVHVLMAEKYGFADRVVGIMRDEEASVAVRLMPRRRIR